MTVTNSAAAANAILDAYEAAVGASATLKIRSGSAPTHVVDSSTGTVLATLNLPSDWMAAASGGSKSKSGTWSDASADATGTAGHYEITASDGTTVHERGSITATGGGGDMTLDSTSITSGQTVTVTTFTKSLGI
jgi:hypothetical protein